ncbi:DinB family protein [Spongiivirga citrea]|uniref:DUF664 domain-containing protein n=1 Tax=Spongiivirga citrea TaxID=1481457 RepID=A0A6M0CX98_9FLAO|nr:DinB family protein [Spongiivirga citrea]NER18350.1 DUF664 domain-containing protein [Spongiivirga citrea]
MKKAALAISFLLISFISQAQYEIKSIEGYSPNIGVLITMLDDLKERVTSSVRDLNQEQTDFLLDDNANRIGAMIYHLAATEKYYQLYTFEGRQFNAEEQKTWGLALGLGESGRDSKLLKGKPIKYYLDIWDDVRADTKKMLKTKDDAWLNTKASRMNYHWAWYHVMEHQANHMGQIRLIQKRAG